MTRDGLLAVEAMQRARACSPGSCAAWTSTLQGLHEQCRRAMVSRRVAMIEAWLAAQPRATALVIGSQPGENTRMGSGKQHSFVQRLLNVDGRLQNRWLLRSRSAMPRPLPLSGGRGRVGLYVPLLASSKPGKPPGAADQSKADNYPQWLVCPEHFDH